MKAPHQQRPDLSLAPLGAGDLIDRAVRFYRKYFWTFVLIAAPPVIVGSVISVAWSLAGRGIFSLSADEMSAEYAFYFLFVWLGTLIIWLVETIATLVVMGGASRNFVRHLLFGEPITFRETYRSVWTRLGGLIFASTIITVVLGTAGLAVLYFGMLIALLVVAAIVAVLGQVPIIAFILSMIIGLGIIFATFWLFFLIASRVAYVPQIMLVEGQGVFSAIGRSAGLAGGNVLRLGALFIFTSVAAYSALALFYVPLTWYASANGVELMPFGSEMVPAWYEVASKLIWQVSLILMTPVWMIGLCLLYIDERVRTEGYDLELMAAARLGEIPSVPHSYSNPLQPALASTVFASPGDGTKRSPIETLGLR